MPPDYVALNNSYQSDELTSRLFYENILTGFMTFCRTHNIIMLIANKLLILISYSNCIHTNYEVAASSDPSSIGERILFPGSSQRRHGIYKVLQTDGNSDYMQNKV